MRIRTFFLCAASFVAAVLASGCKDDVEPGVEPSDVQGLFVNEVCSGGTDWIELYNASDEAMDLTGYHVQDSKGTDEEYTFPSGSSIAAKGFLVLEEGTFEFGISGGGDEIKVLDENYSVIDDVNVPEMEDGFTYARTEDGGSSWEIVEGGTKGRSNGGTPDERPEDPDDGDNPDDDQPSGVDYAALRLNELNGNDKFIELYNSSDADIDIAGVYFTKDDEDTFTAAEGTVVPAKGFLTVWSEKADALEENPGLAPVFEFGLSADKSVKIELFAPDGTSLDVFKNLSVSLGETWGEDDGMYDSKDKGSFARETDGTGDWYIMTATEGESNASAEKVEDDKIEW